MNVIRAILFVVTFAVLTLVVTLGSCYFFPEGPRTAIATNPWYGVMHALGDWTTLLAFAGIGGVVGLMVFLAHWWLSAKLLRGRRLRNGLCVHCGYDLRSGHSVCPECGSTVSLLAR